MTYKTADGHVSLLESIARSISGMIEECRKAEQLHEMAALVQVELEALKELRYAAEAARK